MVDGRAVLGTTLEDVSPELRAQGFMDRLDDVYRTGREVMVEAPLQLRDGASSANLFVDFTDQAVRDPQGATEGILVVVFDVTEDVHARGVVEAIGRSSNKIGSCAPSTRCSMPC